MKPVIKKDINELISGLKKIKNDIEGQSMTILKHKKKDISLSTDKLLHKKINVLIQSISSYPVLSEEDEDQPDFLTVKGYYWIVDPLDGTVNYYRSIPMSCISVALWWKQQPIMGIVVDLNRDEVFLAVVKKNEITDQIGAWLNDRPIRVSSVKQIDQGIVATGFLARGNFETGSMMKTLKLFQNWQKVRLIGSAALSLAWVGCGRMDAYVENSIHIWDVAAGMTIVKAAGGEVSLQPTDQKNRVILAATNGVIRVEEILP
jgi:myo-inositol-1(or 4)-monophosphatase